MSSVHPGKLRGSEVAITSGGNTKSKHIMHIIGPGAIPAFEPSVDRILQACHLKQFKSVAIVAIGTGKDNEAIFLKAHKTNVVTSTLACQM